MSNFPMVEPHNECVPSTSKSGLSNGLDNEVRSLEEQMEPSCLIVDERTTKEAILKWRNAISNRRQEGPENDHFPAKFGWGMRDINSGWAHAAKILVDKDPTSPVKQTLVRKGILKSVSEQKLTMGHEAENRVKKYAKMEQDPVHLDMIRRIFDEKKDKFDKYVQEEGLKRWSSAFHSKSPSKSVMKRPLEFKAPKAVQSSRVTEYSSDPSVLILSSPVVLLDACEVMPRMNYFVNIRTSFRTENTNTLSHIPYVEDRYHDEETFTKELVALYDEGVHGTRKSYKKGINDRILFEMLISVDFQARDEPILRDRYYAALSHLFPDKCGVREIHKKAISLRMRFEEAKRLPYPVPQREYYGKAWETLRQEEKDADEIYEKGCYRCGDFNCVRHNQIDPTLLQQYSRLPPPPPNCMTETQPCSFLCHFLFNERMIHQEENMEKNRKKHGEWRPFWYKILVKEKKRRAIKRTTENGEETIKSKKMRIYGSDEEEVNEEFSDLAIESNEEDEEGGDEDEETCERNENDGDDYNSEIDRAMMSPSTSTQPNKNDSGIIAKDKEQRNRVAILDYSIMSRKSCSPVSEVVQDENGFIVNGMMNDDDYGESEEEDRRDRSSLTLTSPQSSRRKLSITECTPKENGGVYLNGLRMENGTLANEIDKRSENGDASDESKESSKIIVEEIEEPRGEESDGEMSEPKIEERIEDEMESNEEETSSEHSSDGRRRKEDENETSEEESFDDDEEDPTANEIDGDSNERRSAEEETPSDRSTIKEYESSMEDNLEVDKERNEDCDDEEERSMEFNERLNNGMDEISEESEEEQDIDDEIGEESGENEDEEDCSEDEDDESTFTCARTIPYRRRGIRNDSSDDEGEDDSGASSYEGEDEEGWTDGSEWEDEIIEEDGESITLRTRRSFAISDEDIPPENWREKMKVENLPNPFWTEEEEKIVIKALSNGESICDIISDLQKDWRKEMKKYRECYQAHAYLQSKGLVSVKKKQEYDEEEKLSGMDRLQIIKTWRNFNATETLQNDNSLNPCFHTGKCDEQTNPPCECFRLDIPCTKFCSCDVRCRIKWPGCMCRPGQCRSKLCPCYFASWECDPDTCISCGCDDEELRKKCPNMPITSGHKKRIFASRSEIAGIGAFIGEPCRKGELVKEYVGEIISIEESERRGRMYDKLRLSYTFNLNDDEVVDATRAGNVARFINHSLFPNCVARVFVVRGDHRIGIFARRDLFLGEELFFNYGYRKEHVEAFTNRERHERDMNLLDITAPNVGVEEIVEDDPYLYSDDEQEEYERTPEEERPSRFEKKSKPNGPIFRLVEKLSNASL